MVLNARVKLGIFGQTAKFGQGHCLFHISNIGNKNKLTKLTVKFLSSGLTLFGNVFEFTQCANLSDFTLLNC